MLAKMVILFRKVRNNLHVIKKHCNFAKIYNQNNIYTVASDMMKRLFFLTVLMAVAATNTLKAQLPAYTLKDISGKEVRTDTLTNNGRPIIIDFFATWCKPCNRELDAISEVYEEWQEETGVKLIAISIDRAQDVHKVKPLVDNHGWDYEVLIDTNEELKRALGIQAIPYTLILDGKGNIVYRHNGYVDGAEEELIEKVREMGE